MERDRRKEERRSGGAEKGEGEVKAKVPSHRPFQLFNPAFSMLRICPF